MRPDIPEDMVDVSPRLCGFKVGDPVVFTNDYGVEFDLVVRGFASEPHDLEHSPNDPRFIYVFTDAWWFPVRASALRHRKIPEGLGAW